MKVLIDNGHGEDTKGKRSPDGSLLEYAWAREIAARIVAGLTENGVTAELLVPELKDIPLKERVKRIAHHCQVRGSKNVLLVSIHCNAARDNGTWDEVVSGWQVYVSKKASSRSKDMAEMIYARAKALGIMGNRAQPKPDDEGRHYSTWNWTDKDIYILSASSCPAILTENLFMDNRNDCAYLLSEEGKKALVKLHVDAITQYVDAYE